MVSLGSTQNGDYAIYENGTGSGSLVSVSGSNVISGNVEFGTGISSLTNTQVNNLNNAINPGAVLTNVAAVSTTLPGATSTTNLSNINSNTTLTAASGASVNVYNISGSINLQGETLTLSGNSNQYFIFNVSGGITLQAGGFIDFVPSTIGTSGTLDASHVLFIVGGTGNNISISGALLGGEQRASGTFVDQGGNISVTGSSSVTGASHLESQYHSFWRKHCDRRQFRGADLRSRPRDADDHDSGPRVYAHAGHRRHQEAEGLTSGLI